MANSFSCEERKVLARDLRAVYTSTIAEAVREVLHLTRDKAPEKLKRPIKAWGRR